MENPFEIKFHKSQAELDYEKIRREFAQKAIREETIDDDLINRMNEAAKKIGKARADNIDEEVAKENMTPEQREAAEKRKSELYQSFAEKDREEPKW